MNLRFLGSSSHVRHPGGGGGLWVLCGLPGVRQRGRGICPDAARSQNGGGKFWAIKEGKIVGKGEQLDKSRSVKKKGPGLNFQEQKAMRQYLGKIKEKAPKINGDVGGPTFGKGGPHRQ